MNINIQNFDQEIKKSLEDGDDDSGITIPLTGSGNIDNSPFPSPHPVPSSPGPSPTVPPAVPNRNSGPMRGSPRPPGMAGAPSPTVPHPATTGPPPALSGNPNELPKRRPPPPLANKTLSASGVANLIPKEDNQPGSFRPPPPTRHAPPPPTNPPAVPVSSDNHPPSNTENPSPRSFAASPVSASMGSIAVPGGPPRGRGAIRGGPPGAGGAPLRGGPPGVAPRRPPPVKSSPSSDDIQNMVQNPSSGPSIPSSPLKPPPARKIQSSDPQLLSNNNPEASRSLHSDLPSGLAPPRENARPLVPHTQLPPSQISPTHTPPPQPQQSINNPIPVVNNKESDAPARPVRQPLVLPPLPPSSSLLPLPFPLPPRSFFLFLFLSLPFFFIFFLPIQLSTNPTFSKIISAAYQSPLSPGYGVVIRASRR